MSIPFEAYIHQTGDVQIQVAGVKYFDFNNLYYQLNNYDIVSEDNEITVIEGSMTKDQFQTLKLTNLLEE